MTPEQIENAQLLSITQLEEAELALDAVIAVQPLLGKVGKGTLQKIISFIAPYIPVEVSNPFVITTGTVLSNPIEKPSALTIVGGPLTLTQTTGGNINTTQALNVLFWVSNGVTGTWSIGLEIIISTNSSVTVNFLAYPGKLIEEGYRNNSGVFVSAPTWRSITVPVTELSTIAYSLSGGSGANAVSFYNSSGVYISGVAFLVVGVKVGTIAMPAGTAKVVFSTNDIDASTATTTKSFANITALAQYSKDELDKRAFHGYAKNETGKTLKEISDLSKQTSLKNKLFPIDGFWNASGVFTPSVNWGTAEIVIGAGQPVEFNVYSTQTGAAALITYFDASNARITSVNANITGLNYYLRNVVTPALTAKIAISTSRTGIESYYKITEQISDVIELANTKINLNTSGLSLIQRRVSNIGLDDLLTLSYSINALVLTILGYYQSGGVDNALSAVLTVTATTTGSENKNPWVLGYNTNAVWVNNTNNLPLGRRNISSVVVTRLSDSVVLTEDTHYAVDYVNGKLRGLINTGDFNVSVSYNYTLERYDLVQLNPDTKVATIKLGTARDLDALEYRANPDAGYTPLYYIKVIGSVYSLFDVYNYPTLIKRDAFADFDRLVQKNKSRLKSFLRKLNAGIAVKIGRYTDSIGAIQNATPPYTANGTMRDRPDLYLQFYPADTIASLPLFDFGDGAGAVHTKLQYVWKLIDAVTKYMGIAPISNNYGIGSTTTQNSLNNGLWPARLAPAIADNNDLIIFGFGMNELGQSYTLANAISIINQFKAGGNTDVIVMAVPRRNLSGETMANWLKTNALLKMAADATNSAYIPLDWISAPAFIGAMGVDPLDLCSTNYYNHPGILEHSIYGDFMVKCIGL